MQITVKIYDKEVEEMLDRLSGKAKDLSPVMADIAEMVRRSIRRNFKEGGRPEKWKVSARAKRDGGQTLVNNKILMNSFTVESDSMSATVGTNVVYAAVHQLGKKTRPHIIRPKNKKGLMFPGLNHPVKQVNHPGSNIPARPFMMFQPEDRRVIIKKITAYLTE